MKPNNSFSIYSFTVSCVLSALCLLSSCFYKVTQPKELTCPPPPPQNCMPQQWIGIPFDTISTIANSSGYYLKIEPVVLLNTPLDDWGLSFISAKEAIETYSDTSKLQVMRFVKFRSAETATALNGLSTGIRGSSGNITTKGRIAIAGVLPKSNMIGDADIYSFDFNGKELSNPMLIPSPISNSIDWDGQPALTPDGKVLFFASDRPGGFGGTDIWFSINRNGNWNEPVNCGENINSRCDDITPFVSADGKHLLFSSAGRETLGGYDIFRADILPVFTDFVQSGTGNLNTALFTNARNYGAPLNTKRDELFPSSPSGTDTLLYYSSNQLPSDNIASSQKGKFDLYVLHRLPFSPELKRNPKLDISTNNTPAVITSTNVKIHGKVINGSTQKPIANADVTAKELENHKVIDQTKSDTAGNYTLTVPTMKEIEISAQNEDLFYDSHKFRLNSKDTSIELNQNFSLPDKLFLRINFPSNIFDNPYQNVLDSNGNETSQTFVESLDLLAQNLMKFNDKIKKLILIGHTDDVGTDGSNLTLGKKRVDFVVAELTKRGVPKSMFEARTMGESQPLQRRSNEDIETFRKRLRRVELQKIMR